MQRAVRYTTSCTGHNIRVVIGKWLLMPHFGILDRRRINFRFRRSNGRRPVLLALWLETFSNLAMSSEYLLDLWVSQHSTIHNLFSMDKHMGR